MLYNKREVHLLQSWQHAKESWSGKLKLTLTGCLFTYKKKWDRTYSQTGLKTRFQLCNFKKSVSNCFRGSTNGERKHCRWRCLSWQAEWFWRAYILIVIIDFGSVFFSCKVIVVVEGEVWQFITQHSRILSLSSYVGGEKRSRTKFFSAFIKRLPDKMLRLCEKVIVMKRKKKLILQHLFQE